MTTTVWSDVSIEVGTATTNLTLNSISKANPGVVGYTGTDPANGSVMIVTGSGMKQVLNRAFRLANDNTSANTVELEDEDTSGYSTFSSGVGKVVSTWASLSTIQQVNVSGGEPKFADTTTVHDSIATQRPTVASPLVMSMEALFDPSDAGQAALIAASKSKALTAMRLTFASGAVMVLAGYITCTGAPTGSAQDNVTTPVTISLAGLPCVFDS